MVTDESWAEKENQTVRAFKEKKVYKSRNNYNLVCHRLLRVRVSMAAPIQLAWPSSEILFFLNSPKCSDTLSDKSGSFAAVRVACFRRMTPSLEMYWYLTDPYCITFLIVSLEFMF